VNNLIVDVRRRAREAIQRQMRGHWPLVAPLVALLGVGCGARTAIASDIASTMQAAGGSTGAAASVFDWDHVIWDEVLAEGATYLWTGSVTDTWAVVSDDSGSFQRQHWDGKTWTRTRAANEPSARFDGSQIWAVAGDQAFAGSSKNLQAWFGDTWSDWAGTPGCHPLPEARRTSCGAPTTSHSSRSTAQNGVAKR